nr:hypothetical protein L204_04456 [Cryptococcus depauperatus CBS 7855]
MSAVFFSIGREDVDDLVSLLRELSTGQSSQTGGPSESDAEDQHSLYCPCAMHLNLETPAAAASSRGKPLTTDQLITEVDYKSKPSRDLWEYGCDNSRACAPYLDSLLPDEAPIIGDISKAKMKAAEIWGTYMRRNADVTGRRVGVLRNGTFVNRHPRQETFVADPQWSLLELQKNYTSFVDEVLENVGRSVEQRRIHFTTPIQNFPSGLPPQSLDWDSYISRKSGTDKPDESDPTDDFSAFTKAFKPKSKKVRRAFE